MTPADLSRIETLAREATPGPWERDELQPRAVYRAKYDDCLRRVSECPALYGQQAMRDAAYIAAANPAAVLALIERVRELEADAARFRWMARRYDPTDYRRRVDDAIDADMKGGEP